MFMLQRVMSIFSVDVFCLTVPKHFVDEPFFAVCQKYAGNEKVYGKEMGRGECRKFPSKIFCLKLSKQFLGELFTLSLVSDIEKVYASKGYVTIIRGIFLSQSTEPFRRGTLLCCVSENFWSRKSLSKRRGRGSIDILRPKFFVSRCRKVSLGNF